MGTWTLGLVTQLRLLLTTFSPQPSYRLCRAESVKLPPRSSSNGLGFGGLGFRDQEHGLAVFIIHTFWTYLVLLAALFLLQLPRCSENLVQLSADEFVKSPQRNEQKPDWSARLSPSILIMTFEPAPKLYTTLRFQRVLGPEDYLKGPGDLKP